MIDIALLQILKRREDYDKIARYIPKQSISKKTRAIIEDVHKYYELHPDEESINLQAFRSMFFTTWHKNLKEDQVDFYNKVLDNMAKDVSNAIRENMINQLIELDFATKMGNIVEQYEAGDEVDIIHVTGQLYEKAKTSLEKTTGFEFATFDDNSIDDVADGLDWHISAMNDHYRQVLGGDQYIVAGRPGKGKTTFLTHMNVEFAKQLAPNKKIIWFNNESRRQRIMARQIQSALNLTDDELRSMNLEDRRAKYIEIMGSTDRVQVYDIHGKAHYQLEDIIESVGEENIGCIIFDMLDNVKFPMIKEMREDQRLEQLYQWSRELGVRCNCPTFPTSQISNDGSDMLFPPESALKDSKTGKQGACDGIIMIGSVDDPMHERLRGISMPKTKSKKAEATSLQLEILLDEDRGRYIIK